MKTFGRISLIFLLGAVCFVGGAYINSVYTKWFYPNQYENKKFKEYALEEDSGRMAEGLANGLQNETAVTPKNNVVSSEEQPGAELQPAVAAGGECTDCDTVFVIMKYDMTAKTTIQEETEIPAKYMGMTRDGMQEAIAMYVAAPPLSELNQGFVTAELVSFSPERVVMKKSYQKEDEIQKFIILSEQNYVTVYRNDTENIYLYTDIRLDDLPPEVQQEVIRQKYVESEEELYNFLESYSS